MEEDDRFVRTDMTPDEDEKLLKAVYSIIGLFISTKEIISISTVSKRLKRVAGDKANPYLLELLAMSADAPMLSRGPLIAIVLGDINPEIAVDGGTSSVTRGTIGRAMHWGRENRYLADWICPNCSLGYDAHITDGCMENYKWEKMVESYVLKK